MNSSLRSLALFVLFLLPVPIRAQGADWIRANYTKYEYRIPMRDGVQLFTAVYVPKDDVEDAIPILLHAHAVLGLRPTASTSTRRPRALRRRSRRTGYIFVYQDVRGRLDVGGRVRQHAAAQPGEEGRGRSTRAATPTTRSTGCSKNVPSHNGKVGHVGHLVPRLLHRGGHDRRPPGAQGRLAAGARSPTGSSATTSTTTARSSCRTPSTSWPASAGRGRSRPKARRTAFDHGTPDGYEFFLEMGPLANADAEVLQGRRRRSGTR